MQLPPAPEGADAGRLRLKPKLAVDAAAAEPAAEAATDETPPPPPPPKPQFRAPAPEPATFASPFAAEAAPAAEPEPVPPSFSAATPPPAGGAPDASGEAPRFKLKPKGAPAAGGPAGAPPPPPTIAIPLPTGAVFEAPPPEVGRMTMPPFPTAAASTPSRPPIAVPAELDKSILAGGEPEKKPKSEVLKKAAIAVGVLAGFILIFAVYRMFFAPLPKPVINTVKATPAAAKPKPVVVAKATPPPTPDAVPTSAPVAEPPKAAAVADSRPVLAPAAPAPKPVEHLVVTSSTDLGSGIKATTTEMTDGPAASAPFLQWVDNAKIGGVFQGNPPRALINGKIARANQTVDDDLGIIFSGVDAENKQVIFKDKTGAIANKHY